VTDFNRPRSEPTPPDQPDPDQPPDGPYDLREAIELLVCMWEANAHGLHPDPAVPLLPSDSPVTDAQATRAAQVLRMCATQLLGALAGSFPPGEYEPPWQMCLAVPGTCPNGDGPHPFIAPADLHAAACAIQPWEGWRA